MQNSASANRPVQIPKSGGFESLSSTESRLAEASRDVEAEPVRGFSFPQSGAPHSLEEKEGKEGRRDKKCFLSPLFHLFQLCFLLNQSVAKNVICQASRRKA